jgi:hypothetical protein
MTEPDQGEDPLGFTPENDHGNKPQRSEPQERMNGRYFWIGLLVAMLVLLGLIFFLNL